MVVGNGFLINWYYKKNGIEIRRFWYSILSMSKGLIPMIIVGIVLSLWTVSYSWVNLLVRMGILLCAFFVGMLVMGMSDDERGIVKGLIKKVKRNI